MKFEFLLLPGEPNFIFPQGLGWLGWLAFWGIALILFIEQFQKDQTRPRALSASLRWWIFLFLLVLTPLFNLFGVIRLPPETSLPPPGLPIERQGVALLIFSLLPITLAAGLLDSTRAVIIGLLTGFILWPMETHNPFTIPEYVLLSLLLYATFQQRYRSTFYRWLRNPIPATLLISFLFIPVIIISNALYAQGSLETRLDFAFTQLRYEWAVLATELAIAGVITFILTFAYPRAWGNISPLTPSPTERSLTTRFLYNLAPLALLLFILLIAVSWSVAGDVARTMLQERMVNTAENAIAVIPLFIGTGQNLIQQISQDPIWFNAPPDIQASSLRANYHLVPYFTQLLLLNTDGELEASYPPLDASQNPLYEQELAGIQRALEGIPPIQTYTIPPLESQQSALVSFIASVKSEDQQTVKGVLIGRTEIEVNPINSSMLVSLKSMTSLEGSGMLIDENQQILFHSNYSGLLDAYTGPVFDQGQSIEDRAPDGSRRLLYYLPARGHPWAVVLTVPARVAQQQALKIATPLLLTILFISLLAVISLRFSVRIITRSLETLAAEADRIASGKLDHPLAVSGEDEVSRLSRSFEQMRLSLNSRLEESKRLLEVSEGIAGNLEMEEAVKPLLQAALTTGACAARIVLTQAALPEAERDYVYPRHYGAGRCNDRFSHLDDQVLNLTSQQPRVALNHLSRIRLFNMPAGKMRPEALLAYAINHEKVHYGTLWLAFDQPHEFREDEMRFIATLARQAELAATNARLFQNADIGRQRLSSILASTADPVLVTDSQNRLYLANPAALQVLGINSPAGYEQPLDKVLTHPELVQLLSSSTEDQQSAEILLPDGHTFLAVASPVLAGGRQVGRVCVLRDVTRFKELDALKSEFVATVSHDLRAPLTLIRGYTTMLEMVGSLNEQQKNYTQKIVASVETMSKLVNNLLDLGRLEAGIGLQLEIVPVREALERAIAPLQLTAAQKQIQLSLEMPEDTSPLIEVDHALLQQALQNLIENAIKYTNPGGTVRVRTLAHDDNIIFEVSDNGIGIAPVDLPRLFEKFYRGAQRDARKQQGSGLGLAIVKSIVERHGGKVWVESQLGKGSTFSILMPIRQSGREK